MDFFSRAIFDIFDLTVEYGLSVVSESKNTLDSLFIRAESFFIEECGQRINRLIDSFEDEVSKASYISYLKQRIFAYVFDFSDICYPVAPPKITQEWRNERELTYTDFPVLKNINGTVIENTHYKYVYVYDQYSIENVVEVKKGNIVADIGAFIGDTSLYFGRKIGSDGRVYAFEISEKSIEVGKHNMKMNGIDNVVFINKAVSDRVGKVRFNQNNNNSMNCISDLAISYNGQSFGEVDTISIDEYFLKNGIKVDFIKADIEGAEMLMLQGAKQTLMSYKPVLAICLYHKKYDFIEIPEFIKSCCPDYKFFFRSEAEPVLFATV